MFVELGNTHPLGAGGQRLNLGAPTVTYVNIPDSYSFDPSLDLKDFALHLVRNPDITRLPGNEALLVIAHPLGGVWKNHSVENPTFVWSDNEQFQGYLSEFFGTAAGRPQHLEEEYFTFAGAPGVYPGAIIDLQANITQNGRDMWARALGGGQVGYTGETGSGGSAPTSTGLTDSGSPAWTTNQWAGCRVFAQVNSSSMVYAIIVSNSASALVVDRWYTIATPGGAAGTTPQASGVYVIQDGNAPAWFMGLSSSTTALASPSTNTSLPSEITSAGGGLIRKICPYAHSASANTFTLTPVFTANGSDTLPVTIGSIGVFDSMVASDSTSTMLFNTLLSTTATLSAIGDQLTVTETVTGT